MKYLLASSLILTGCASSLAALSPRLDETARPSYVDHVDGWLFGLLGTPGRFDLRQVCVDEQPLGLRQGLTTSDVLLTLVTVGIYAPTTIKVWCGR